MHDPEMLGEAHQPHRLAALQWRIRQNLRGSHLDPNNMDSQLICTAKITILAEIKTSEKKADTFCPARSGSQACNMAAPHLGSRLRRQRRRVIRHQREVVERVQEAHPAADLSGMRPEAEVDVAGPHGHRIAVHQD